MSCYNAKDHSSFTKTAPGFERNSCSLEVVRAPKCAGFWSKVENTSKTFTGSDASSLVQPRASCSTEHVVRRQGGQ